MSDQNQHLKPTISDADRQVFTAADAALTTTKPWECDIRSPALKKLAWILVVLVLAVHLFMSLVVDVGTTGEALTFLDKWAFLGVGVVLAVLAYLAFSRPRVRANEDGVQVRNIIGTRFYPWSVIYGLRFPEGSRMALLELPDFEYVPLWAIQSADGKKALAAVREFRDLEAKYLPKE
ncbi:PH domain-containing protein [Corynebacterium poyangense]|uniref:PH domain-containing protein n=1 Tax=Corynebacterium poyangense TaxID=2684405 RepID=A0A7H0SP08_9CORY|nr:PH domain-containing protein [Corynebacterium poyangense]MBZ8177844.1 PH domain-containing protein [Corynebacterium poyangense]QNQ90283.1 PH domain-containing protein [Corynebacterium poyangense]